jgi:hypothetical protein
VVYRPTVLLYACDSVTVVYRSVRLMRSSAIEVVTSYGYVNKCVYTA